MICERALATFDDGHQEEFPLFVGPAGERTWSLLCRAACYYAQERTGKQYRPAEVRSVRIREGSEYGTKR